MRCRTDARAAALVAAALACAPSASGAPPTVGHASSAESPALVVLIAVDQLRRDRLDDALPGGLGRLARDGRVYADAALAHATTETCAGHATMLSGRHPGPMGVPGNRFVDRATGERVYCVEDRAPDGAVLGREAEYERDPTTGRSPRLLRFGGLGGWMKAARPSVRVYAVSAKDRSAIAMTGRDGDVAYWLDPDADRFTTSRYYRDALPDWVGEWNASALASLPPTWTHAPEGTPEDGVARPDDFAGESDAHARTSPHPLAVDDAEDRAENVWVSPYLDALTLDFARTLVEREDLGGRGETDLLAVSLSATDTVGHAYGPHSAEARDALARLDRDLGAFLDFLDLRLGPGRVLVALTSDHGVLPLPEWLAAVGEDACPVEGGRKGPIGLIARLFLEMHVELSPFSVPRSWIDYASQLTIDRSRARARGVPVERAVAVAEAFLEAEPVVREAWTEREIFERDDEIAKLYRNAFDPERSGDLAIQVEPGCLLDFGGSGTTHGSPYAYDRDVPVVFYGPGVPRGRVEGPAATVDVGPTLAGRLGVATPDDLDGRDLLRGSMPPAQPDAAEPDDAVDGSRNTSGSM